MSKMIFNPEFQAVVLAAGKGSRMPEITSGMPKCLIPVGAKPLVWYPLNKLQKSGFTEAIMIVLESQKNEIQSVLEKTDLEIKIEYFPIDGAEDLGTADSLKRVQDKLESDVIVVSCDVITDVNLNEVLDMFRKHDSSFVSLFFNPRQSSNVTPGPKSKHKPERDLVGIDALTQRLVFLASASDYESELSVPRHLIKKHNNIHIRSNLIDSHIYLIKNWIIKYLVAQQNFSTIKGELLPYIVKKQMVKIPKVKGTPPTDGKPQSDDIMSFAQEDELNLIIKKVSSANDYSEESTATHYVDTIRCYAVIADSDSYGARINTLPAYWNINNEISDIWEEITENATIEPKHPKADIKSTQVDDKCFIWEGAKLNEKTSFKNSVIGSNTVVNSFTRVFNSIVMNNVVINERVALENCIVSDGAVISQGCQLKGCIVGSQCTVADNSSHNNEILTVSDRLMEF